MFRKLAGRPASPEIEAARTAIEAERAARRADSLKNASLMEAKADSVRNVLVRKVNLVVTLGKLVHVAESKLWTELEGCL